MKPRPEKPYVGDVHLLKDYPADTPLTEITEFEVWNGQEWVHSSQGSAKVYAPHLGMETKVV